VKAWSNEHLSLHTVKQLKSARDYVAGNATRTSEKNKRTYWKWQRAVENIEAEIEAREKVLVSQ